MKVIFLSHGVCGMGRAFGNGGNFLLLTFLQPPAPGSLRGQEGASELAPTLQWPSSHLHPSSLWLASIPNLTWNWSTSNKASYCWLSFVWKSSPRPSVPSTDQLSSHNAQHRLLRHSQVFYKYCLIDCSYYYSYYIDEEIGTQSNQIVCLRSHIWKQWGPVCLLPASPDCPSEPSQPLRGHLLEWQPVSEPTRSNFLHQSQPRHKSRLGSCPRVIGWASSCLPHRSWSVAILRLWTVTLTL